ncbi:MAG: DUF2855 family protein [Bacteroidota bacterium]
MPNIKAQDFMVNLTNLHESQILEKAYPEVLAPNQVLLEIDKFSLTSNNITYGVVGKQMNYWQFFPTQSGYGIIPAWGLANVIASNHPDIPVGQRYYGYYPMSTHLMVEAERVTGAGFVDNAAHRRALPPIYNYYTNTANDPSFSPETEDFISIFRPLFITSFLIDDHLAEQDYFGASRIILTSASSKTAQALACQLANRKKQAALDLEIEGLTSEQNIDFVNGLGCYDSAINYDEVTELNTGERYIVIDFTGNHNTQYQLQTVLGDNLVHNCLVGLVDWQNLEGDQKLPKKGEFFFAPTYAQRRQKEWGVSGFQQKVGAAWQQFMSTIQSSITLKEHIGTQALAQLYSDMLLGKIDPQHGNIVRLNK